MAGHNNGGWGNTGSFFGSCVSADYHAKKGVSELQEEDTYKCVDLNGITTYGLTLAEAQRICQVQPGTRMIKE